MMVSCSVSDVLSQHRYSYHSNLASAAVNYAALSLPRARHMSGGSTGSLGSVEAELSSGFSGSSATSAASLSLPPESPSSGASSLSRASGDVSMHDLNVLTTNTTAMFMTASQGIDMQDGAAAKQHDSPDQQQQSQKNNILNPTRYKTERCRPFDETGYCKYGEKCQFAHGDHQLRHVPRHPKYKTELCRTFHTTGFCPYGPRCHFIHSEDETKLGEINQMKAQYAHQQAVQELASQAARWQLANAAAAGGGTAPGNPTTNTVAAVASLLDPTQRLKALLALGGQSPLAHAQGVGHPVALGAGALWPLQPGFAAMARNSGAQLPPQFSALFNALPTTAGAKTTAANESSQLPQLPPVNLSQPPPPLMRSDTLGSSGESPLNSASSSPISSPMSSWGSGSPLDWPTTQQAPSFGQAFSFSAGATSERQFSQSGSNSAGDKQAFLLPKTPLGTDMLSCLSSSFERMLSLGGAAGQMSPFTADATKASSDARGSSKAEDASLMSAAPESTLLPSVFLEPAEVDRASSSVFLDEASPASCDAPAQSASGRRSMRLPVFSRLSGGE